jgi:preprotein translocase subunit SecG
MSEAILIGMFFAVIICMGYLFGRAGMKQDKRKGDE